MQPEARRSTGRPSAIDHLYRALSHLMRRRSELGGAFHPELTLVGYTVLAQIEAVPGTRATDLAALFGLDKSTVSRQLDQLELAGFVRRDNVPVGRRGHSLVVTADGEAALEREATGIRGRLTMALAEWKVGEIVALADMVDRFIEDLR